MNRIGRTDIIPFVNNKFHLKFNIVFLRISIIKYEYKAKVDWTHEFMYLIFNIEIWIHHVEHFMNLSCIENYRSKYQLNQVFNMLQEIQNIVDLYTFTN